MINKVVGIGFGAIYVLVGLLGFFVTGISGFASTDGGLLLGLFMVNPLHNIVHVLVGTLLIIGGLASIKSNKLINTTVGAVYLLVFILGLVVQGSTANILALNTVDHGLHLASALLLVGVGLGADRSSARAAAS